MEKATFGMGCFWHSEEAFRKVKGVKETAVGFMGGKTKNPSYEDVSGGDTGHVEVVDLKFDLKEVSYEELLKIFWGNHDPTQLNRQGVDVGSQYRSVVFYYNDEQKKAAEKTKPKNAVTEIVLAGKFYRAEEYHQRYAEKHGGATCTP